VPTPVEIIDHARRRIARLAAARAMLYGLVPALATIVLAVFLEPIGRGLWDALGYVMAPDRATAIRLALTGAAGAELAAGALLAWRAWRRAWSFVAAAQRVDEIVGGHEEILTFAALSDPDLGGAVRATRTPLFPLLFRRARALLEKFDVERACPLGLGRPLGRSSMIAAVLAAIFLLSTLGLVRAPSPAMEQAARLRQIAREIEKSAATPGDRALARAVGDVADALENPNLPPEEKLKQLEKLKQEIDKQQKKGQQAVAGTGKGKAEGQSKGKTGNGKGNGNGSGGTGARGKGAGAESGGNGKKKGEPQSIELQNEIAKAEAQIETEGAKNNQPRPGGGEGKAPRPGTSPEKKGAGPVPNPNQPGNIPRQGASGRENLPAKGGTQQRSDMGSSQGDTHLGEFPAPVKYQRYLKPGEKGAGLEIKDARYVTFRIPGAVPVGAGGAMVTDKNAPKASTPYVNAPLAPSRENAPPDERQLVPPRYRDLIH
jgi:hypothetical protein